MKALERDDAKLTLTTLVHNIISWNFLNCFVHRLPWCNGLFFHSRRDTRSKRDIFRFNIVGAFVAACLHVQNVHAEAFLLDSIVCIDGDGVVVVVVVIADAVLKWRCLNVKLLSVDIDWWHGAIVIKVRAAIVTADGWRSDSDGGCAVSTARHRLIVIRLRFPPSLIRRE